MHVGSAPEWRCMGTGGYTGGWFGVGGRSSFCVYRRGFISFPWATGIRGRLSMPVVRSLTETPLGGNVGGGDLFLVYITLITVLLFSFLK